MKLYKYFIVFTILISSVVMVLNVDAVELPGNVYENITNPTRGHMPTSNVTDVQGLAGIVVKVLTWTYTIFFVVAVLFVLFAAYAYLGGGEDAEKIKNAHKKIIWASVAIAVALLALSVNLIVQNFIGASGGGTQQNLKGGTGGSPSSQPCVSTKDFLCPGSWQ